MKVPYIFVIIYWYGVLAQLVERYTGSVEVSGNSKRCGADYGGKSRQVLPRLRPKGGNGRIRELYFIYGTASAVPFCVAEHSGRLKRRSDAIDLRKQSLFRALLLTDFGNAFLTSLFCIYLYESIYQYYDISYQIVI